MSVDLVVVLGAKHAAIAQNQILVASFQGFGAEEAVETSQVVDSLVQVDSHHQLQGIDGFVTSNAL